MDTEKQSHPHVKPERRTRSLSRPGPGDRRKSPRFYSTIPITIFVGQGETAKEYSGTITDISDGGIMIENTEIPETEERLRLDFVVPEGVLPEDYVAGRYQFDGNVKRKDKETGTIGVQFQQPISMRLARTTWRYLRWLASFGLVATIFFIVMMKVNSAYDFWFDVPLFLYSLLVGTFLITRFLFSSFYRPPRPTSRELPTITVLYPIYNEEDFIERTITHAFESDYPSDKIQVIAVNDGSTDGTLEVMQKVREKYPELIILNFERSWGKRQAIAAGSKLASGEILILSDSDSFFEPDAFRKMINGFDDPKVGAVTGHCEVENIWANMLTKMQAVRYFVSFRIMKAAESVFDVVTCLSGPCAAYRRSLFEELVDDWRNQTWLGAPATFGDDRSLTNSVLKKGYNVIYDSSAITRTIVPIKYKQFLSQQLRWKKSWFRESLRACTFMWKKPPLASLSFYTGFLLPMLGPIVVFRAIILAPLMYQASPMIYILGILLMSCMVSSAYLFLKRSPLWIYGIPFCFFYMFVLVWQLPWAILTVRESKWGTR